MENFKPIYEPMFDDAEYEALKTYAPAAFEDLLKEMRFTSWWNIKLDEVYELYQNGLRPLALLIHELASYNLEKEVKELRYALSRFIEQSKTTGDEAEMYGRSALLSMRQLHDLRNKRLENFCNVIPGVKSAIRNGDLVVRHGSPPYLPVEDTGRFGWKAWLESKKDYPVEFHDRYPDARLVVKISEAEAWLSKMGAAFPDCIEKAMPKEPSGLRGYMNRILEAIDGLGRDRKSLKQYGKHGKGDVKRKVEKMFPNAPVSESMFNKAWTKLIKNGEIAN